MEDIGRSIAAEFNSWLDEYTEKMVRIVPFYFELMEDLHTLIPKEFQPTSVLDLGAGNGNLSARLIKWFPNASHTLVDASEQMLAEAKSRFPDRDLLTETTMIQEVDFAQQAPDLVAASFSLHHLPHEDKKNTFKKIHAGMRQGGLFMYSDLMVNKDEREHAALISYWKDFVFEHSFEAEWTDLMKHYELYDHPASERLQVQWLKEAGFSSVQAIRHDTCWVAMVAAY